MTDLHTSCCCCVPLQAAFSGLSETLFIREDTVISGVITDFESYITNHANNSSVIFNNQTNNIESGIITLNMSKTAGLFNPKIDVTLEIMDSGNQVFISQKFNPSISYRTLQIPTSYHTVIPREYFPYFKDATYKITVEGVNPPENVEENIQESCWPATIEGNANILTQGPQGPVYRTGPILFLRYNMIHNSAFNILFGGSLSFKLSCSRAGSINIFDKAQTKSLASFGVNADEVYEVNINEDDLSLALNWPDKPSDEIELMVEYSTSTIDNSGPVTITIDEAKSILTPHFGDPAEWGASIRIVNGRVNFACQKQHKILYTITNDTSSPSIDWCGNLFRTRRILSFANSSIGCSYLQSTNVALDWDENKKMWIGSFEGPDGTVHVREQIACGGISTSPASYVEFYDDEFFTTRNPLQTSLNAKWCNDQEYILLGTANLSSRPKKYNIKATLPNGLSDSPCYADIHNEIVGQIEWDYHHKYTGTITLAGQEFDIEVILLPEHFLSIGNIYNTVVKVDGQEIPVLSNTSLDIVFNVRLDCDPESCDGLIMAKLLPVTLSFIGVADLQVDPSFDPYAEPVTLSDKASNYIESTAEWASGEFGLRSQEEINDILKVCQECPFYKNNACEKCGCSINAQRNGWTNKIARHNEHCPIDKW